MNQFQASAWYYATTLNERIASLRADSDNYLNCEQSSELAKRRMKRWRSQAPFTNDAHFTKRLAIDNINEEQFLALLGESTESIRKRFAEPCDWLVDLEQAFTDRTFQPHPLPDLAEIKGQEISLFLYAIEPLIYQGRRRLEQEIEKLNLTRANLAVESNTIVDLLFTNLPGQLLSICSRTMVLEMQAAKMQGVLQGETSQQRFVNFVENLRDRGQIISLLQEYPVMARQLVLTINQWVKFCTEFLQHLRDDWEAIKTTFSPNREPGKLVEVNFGEGDTHKNGRSVAIAVFESGFKLVYKPRSLATDIHFLQLLAWLNQRSQEIDFRLHRVLNRDSHGWVEFVEVQSCQSIEEVEKFYERQGGFLALLYALEATDFHSENSIAAGEYPILIDLESLFHPGKANKNNFDTNDRPQLSQSNQLANDRVTHSVLRSGLLPQRSWQSDKDEGVDISGLGSQKGQLTPHQLPYWQDMGTDQMQLKSKRMEMPETQNRPTLNGEDVSLLDYATFLLAGFKKIYQLLIEHRDDLLAEDGPIAAFAEDEVRVILRPTRFYGLLLLDSFHPNMLRNALERDRLFDRLWFGIEHQPYLAKVTTLEHADLWNGDIPMFTTRANSRHLYSSSHQQISDFFAESGIDSVKRRLQELGQEDLEQQIYLIEASLVNLAIDLERADMPTYPFVPPQQLADRQRLLTAAEAIGEHLEKIAVRTDNDASWIGLKPINERFYTVDSLGADLYNGLPGIILFLAYLGAVTSKQRYTDLAKAALVTLNAQIETGKLHIKSIGGFEGWGSIIYTLTNLGTLWNDAEPIEQAQELVKSIPPLIEEDKGLDIIAGSAGAILSLLNLYRCTASPSILTSAINCGDRLLARSQKMSQGIGWEIAMKDTKPLAGFAHGAAGIAWALLELGAVTKEQRFRTAALEGMAYERSLFRPELGNWPDLRVFSDRILAENEHNCMSAWCHGAPGIGMARLASLAHLDDAEIRAEIDTALKTTLEKGFGGNHSLCHGDLGNLELLLQASLTLEDFPGQDRIDYLATVILDSIDRHGWLCGIHLGVETPGLMTGLAGIGYQLLRLAASDRVPSVLLLESLHLKHEVQAERERVLSQTNS